MPWEITFIYQLNQKVFVTHWSERQIPEKLLLAPFSYTACSFPDV